jgi:TatA/E family protein of Tat protein translocase
MFGIGTTELLVILFIILLVFGSKKLPELAKGLGKGINEFKRASQEIQSELDINAPLKETKKETDKTDKAQKKEDENTSKSE